MKRRGRIVKRREADEQPWQGKLRRSHEPNGEVNSHRNSAHQPEVQRQPLWPPEARATLADVWPAHARPGR